MTKQELVFKKIQKYKKQIEILQQKVKLLKDKYIYLAMLKI